MTAWVKRNHVFLFHSTEDRNKLFVRTTKLDLARLPTLTVFY